MKQRKLAFCSLLAGVAMLFGMTAQAFPALLGVTPQHPLIANVFPDDGDFQFDQFSGEFTVTDTRAAIQLVPSGPVILTSAQTDALLFDIFLDGSGALVSGTFTLTGTVDLGSGPVSGSLLTGTVDALGGSLGENAFDMRLVITGGLIANNLFPGGNAVARIDLENQQPIGDGFVSAKPKVVIGAGGCALDVLKTGCIIIPAAPSTNGCTGGAIALTLEYTGQNINSATTVTITGSGGATVTYSLPSLHTGDVLTKPSENGFTIDATAHSQSKLGSTTTVVINGVKEVLHTSCSCTANPTTNLKVCNPICLDASSPDNSTGSKGPGSPLWTLVALDDPKLGIEMCDNGGNPLDCSGVFTSPDCVSVLYTYVITNKSAVAVSNVEVHDDLLGAVPGSPIPLIGPGKSVTLMATGTVCCTTTNTVTVLSAEGCAATDQAVIKKCAPVAACTPPYPFASANPLTSLAFNESEVLRTAIVTVAEGCMPDQIRVFYNDEHALTMGVRRVIVKNKSGTTTTDYAVTPLSSDPGSALNPSVGSQITTGDQAGTDLAGRPLYPALFLTDLTVNPNPLGGDWQFGGTPIPPHAVFGTWKGAVRTVDNTKAPQVVTVTPDTDPAKNDWNLDGGDPAPAGLVNQGYGAEVRWDVSKLGLIPGHTYRLYFMVHDGDQNKSGGDVGQACAVVGAGTDAAACPPPVCPALGACTPPYPFASANALTSIPFNESEVLRTSLVAVVEGCLPDEIRMYYNDEHALTLGVRRVIVKTKTGSTTTDYPVSLLPGNPGSVLDPDVGSEITTGDQAGTDLSGRPLFPSLFITDLTVNPNPLGGDWQFGGTPIPPHAVFGTWKAAVKTIDKTKAPQVVTVTPDVDPAKNNWNLDGGDPAPAGLVNQGYGAEVRWDVSKLGLIPGDKYRFYFMVHDGDQNKSGGDVGQACATMTNPVKPPP